MYGGVSKPLKYSVIFFNWLFVVFGIVLIGVGAWVETHAGQFTGMTSIKFMAGNRVMMFVGSVMAITCLFGVHAALTERKIHLAFLFLILLVLLSVEISGIIVAYENRDKAKSSFENRIRQSTRNYPDKHKDALDEIQRELECCGTDNGTSDYMVNNDLLRIVSVPDSCCKPPYQGNNCGRGQLLLNSAKLFTEPCIPKIKDLLSKKVEVIGALSITVLVLQIIGMCLILVMIFKVKENRQSHTLITN